MKGTIKSQPTLSTSIRNVLWATSSNNSLLVSTLARKSGQHVLVQVTAQYESAEESKAREFAEIVMAGAYEGELRSIYEFQTLATELTRCTLLTLHLNPLLGIRNLTETKVQGPRQSRRRQGTSIYSPPPSRPKR